MVMVVMPYEALVPFDCFRMTECFKQSQQPDVCACNYNNDLLRGNEI